MEYSDEMTFDELVPTNSKYLTKDDVGEDGVNLTIAGFKRITMAPSLMVSSTSSGSMRIRYPDGLTPFENLEGDHGDEEKTIMGFVEEGYKPMVLNKTNSQLIPLLTGAENPGEAKGKQVNVFNDITISFGGRITGGIRLRKPIGSGSKAPSTDEPNDEIPF